MKPKEKITLLQKIELDKKKHTPKSIMDKVKTIHDVIRISKPSKEILSIVNYKGKD